MPLPCSVLIPSALDGSIMCRPASVNFSQCWHTAMANINLHQITLGLRAAYCYVDKSLPAHQSPKQATSPKKGLCENINALYHWLLLRKKRRNSRTFRTLNTSGYGGSECFEFDIYVVQFVMRVFHMCIGS